MSDRPGFIMPAEFGRRIRPMMERGIAVIKDTLEAA
jgi:hypothetical protein